ncbi:MAG: carboxymuconolactone decarboxylase family protein, partial [Bacteroidota bacterium]|nr:carboxymuconolactone decarboxylase family protein [Bacteroidota bacterium]
TIPNAVTQEIADKMRKHWDDGEIVEILGVISLFGYLNRWNDSMATQLEVPAKESGKTYLEKMGWNAGKHNHD